MDGVTQPSAQLLLLCKLVQMKTCPAGQQQYSAQGLMLVEGAESDLFSQLTDQSPIGSFIYFVPSSSSGTEFPPVSSAAGSDSALGSDSTPVTPPPVTTNSTASFVTVSGSAHDFEPTPQLPPGPTQRSASWQPDSWIAFDDISPEVPQRTQLLLAEGAEPEVGGVKSEEVWRRRRGQTDSNSFRPYLLGPPLQGGAGDLLSQLKNLGGTVELEVGGARSLLKAVLPGTWREIKKKTQGRANHGNAAGDDVIKSVQPLESCDDVTSPLPVSVGMTLSPGEEYDPNCGTPTNNVRLRARD